jgi:hypothetical protein
MGNDFLKKFANADINWRVIADHTVACLARPLETDSTRAVVAAARLFIDFSCVPDANISQATVGSIRAESKAFR